MFKKVKRSLFKKLYINIEKEESWLNNLSAHGYGLKEISKGYYIFEKCTPDEYTYRIDFLTMEDVDNPDSYLTRIETLQAELLYSSGRWRYFRRKASLGSFEIYEDLNSKVKLYKRINLIWYMPAFISFFVGVDIFPLIIKGIFFKDLIISDFILNLIFLLIGLYFLFMALPLQRKIYQLSREKNNRG